MTFDPQLLIGLGIAAVFCLLVLAVPGLARARYLWLVTLLAAAIYYRREFFGFVLVNAIAYLVMRRVATETGPERRWRFALLAMLALAAVFTAGRIWHWDHPYSIPGIGSLALFSLGMWPLLKLMTLFWEVGSGSVTAPSLTQYVVWNCLPFTLVGPVLRWSQMPAAVCPQAGVLRSSQWWLSAAAATAKFVAGAMLIPAHAWLEAHWHSHFGVNAVATFVTGPLSFYLAIAGYFHWMELLGSPCSIKIPPSFNYPIGRENISAFWMNWNMTATYVFRDYLFYNRWGRSTYNVYFNTILLFTLVGLWHATNAYWILWGFLHGLLFVTYLLWRKYSSRLGKIPLRGTPLATNAARVLTYVSVCMCWYLPSKILQKLAAL